MAFQQPRSIWFTLANVARFVFWLLLIVLVVMLLMGGPDQEARQRVLEEFQAQRNSRVIALIHRQETASILGIPLARYITIEDSEAILRVIRLTPPEMPIDLILHTPGGLVLAAEQIARALVERKPKVTVFVPHYAMSGGTLIALAADEIVMDPNAVLGPVDPQLGPVPAASIVKVLEQKKPEDIEDATIVLADIAAKARAQVSAFVAQILTQHMPPPRATTLATVLSDGRWTHDFPITVPMVRDFGLPVSTEMPLIVYRLMELYPQAAAQRPSVIYTPTPQTPEQARGDRPRAQPGQ